MASHCSGARNPSNRKIPAAWRNLGLGISVPLPRVSLTPSYRGASGAACDRQHLMQHTWWKSHQGPALRNEWVGQFVEGRWLESVEHERPPGIRAICRSLGLIVHENDNREFSLRFIPTQGLRNIHVPFDEVALA